MHAAEAEMGLARTYMQSGSYQYAISLAAHAAGAHRDAPGATVLYAWLLHVGGQSEFAQNVLDGTEVLRPGDALIARTRALLRSDTPVAAADLLAVPWRTTPFDVGATLPALSYGICSGLLIDGGRRAVVRWIEAPTI